jgi:hypothetical protein
VPRSPGDFVCDFCGQETTKIRRVALDVDYDRLTAGHKPKYACHPCSEQKERERMGLERGPKKPNFDCALRK